MFSPPISNPVSHSQPVRNPSPSNMISKLCGKIHHNLYSIFISAIFFCLSKLSPAGGEALPSQLPSTSEVSLPSPPANKYSSGDDTALNSVCNVRSLVRQRIWHATVRRIYGFICRRRQLPSSSSSMSVATREALVLGAYCEMEILS